MKPSQEQLATLLREIAGGASVAAAAKAAGIHRPRVYTLRDRDPAFAAELLAAREAGRESRRKPPVVAEVPRRRPSGYITPFELTRRQRRLVRDFLEAFDAPPEPHEMTPRELTDYCLGEWLAGRQWPGLEIDETILGRLSRRALADYRRTLMVREAERAANDPSEPPE